MYIMKTHFVSFCDESMTGVCNDTSWMIIYFLPKPYFLLLELILNRHTCLL